MDSDKKPKEEILSFFKKDNLPKRKEKMIRGKMSTEKKGVIQNERNACTITDGRIVETSELR